MLYYFHCMLAFGTLILNGAEHVRHLLDWSFSDQRARGWSLSFVLPNFAIVSAASLHSDHVFRSSFIHCFDVVKIWQICGPSFLCLKKKIHWNVKLYLFSRVMHWSSWVVRQCVAPKHMHAFGSLALLRAHPIKSRFWVQSKLMPAASHYSRYYSKSRVVLGDC